MLHCEHVRGPCDHSALDGVLLLNRKESLTTNTALIEGVCVVRGSHETTSVFQTTLWTKVCKEGLHPNRVACVKVCGGVQK